MERSQLLYELAVFDLDVSLYASVPDAVLKTILDDLKRINAERLHFVDLEAAHEAILKEGMLACPFCSVKIGADED